MIYIKRLIQRKKTKPLFGILFSFMLGIFCIFSALYDFIIENQLYYTGTYLNALTNGSRIFTYFLPGRILLGTYIIYLAIFCLPKWTSDSQNKEDYYVITKDAYIDIRFQKWIWHIKAEDISASSFFFFDEARHFVSPTRGFQVYNAVKAFFPEVIGKTSHYTADILNTGKIHQFEHTRKAAADEIEMFLKKASLNSFHLFTKFFSLLLIISGFSFFSYSQIELGIFLLLLWGFSILLILCGLYLFWWSGSDSRTRRWIQNHGLFIAKGYLYARHTSHSDDGIHYMIKVWDGTKIYLSDWLCVDKNIYNQSETTSLSLYYYIDKNSIYHIELVTQNRTFK